MATYGYIEPMVTEHQPNYFYIHDVTSFTGVSRVSIGFTLLGPFFVEAHKNRATQTGSAKAPVEEHISIWFMTASRNADDRKPRVNKSVQPYLRVTVGVSRHWLQTQKKLPRRVPAVSRYYD